MEEPETTRYWCHGCAQVVSPIMEVELKCPYCDRGFVEEMGGVASGESDEFGPDIGSDQTLSLWAPVLLGMMGNLRRRRRARRLEFDEEDNEEEDDGSRENGETELVREIESIIRRRRRSSASILQLLQGIRAGIGSDLGNLETDRDGRRDGDGDGGERVILITPFSQTIVLQGSSNDSASSPGTMASLGDYFAGPGLDFLLQHLAENDPNRSGTPPAQKEAVEALPTVKITADVNVQCSVCLDEFDIGAEAKEMPCKHKFHPDCILPWLDVHSSCPVCRYQMPSDESKVEPDDVSRIGIMRRRRDRVRERERERESTGTRNAPIYGRDHEEADGSGSSEYAGQMEGGSGPNSASSTGRDVDERNENVGRFSLPWPFNLFSSSTGLGSGSSEYAGQMEGGSGPNSASSTGGDVDERNENVGQFSLPWPFNLFSSSTGLGNTQSTARNNYGSTSRREDS